MNNNKLFISQVQNVWNEGQNLNILKVRGDEAHFDVNKLPIFFNLRIMSLGLTNKERDEIKEIIKCNGGKLVHSIIMSEVVDVLITNKKSIECQKFNEAVELKKPCLNTAWILDSYANGHAMPVENYNLK
jgi:NAD-dependent DNA ligase